MENAIFFLILREYNSMRIQQLQHWHSKCNSTEICLAALNRGGKLKVRFHLPAIQLFISTWEKSYDHIYLSPPHVSIITGNILITITRFACCDLLLASNSTFMTHCKYLGTI